jgi:hypothetical protein
MYRKAIVLLGTLALALFLTIALAPQANAGPAQQTGVFQTRYFNFYDAGGRECPDASASYVTGDTEIFKYWPEGTSPVPGIINTTNYMVCWRGTVYFPAAGTYTVYTLNDDGMNVWVNGNIAMNAWYNQGPTWHQGDFNIPAPGYYSFEVKYYNAPNAGVACVTWGLKGQPYTWKCPYPPAPPPTPPPPPCPYYPNCYPTPVPPCPNWPDCNQPCPTWPNCNQPCPTWPNCNQPCPTWPNCYNPPPLPPPQPPPPVDNCWYRIRYGDTLYGIAWKFGVTTWQLQQWNHINNPNLIYAGMVIKVCGW